MRHPISATYRLQLRGPQADPQGRAFGFKEAADQVEYLAQLGISHLYLSPILTSVPSSNHSYDVINPTEINPELGGMDGFKQLADKAHAAGLGIIIDIVPNHVGVETPQLNEWWWDVLKRGKESQYESFFDIDWHEDNGADGKLGLPVLGAEGDEDKLVFDEFQGEPVLKYYDHIFPVAPGSIVDDDPLGTYQKQSYRLMYWRDGVIGYRRFFSVNGLAGLRQEDPLVFEHTHTVLRELVALDLIDGVRVDHPDGLSDPFGYLTRLRDVLGPDRWLIIEKILGVDEPLDPRLSVDGTSGYDALREFDGVFVHRESEDALSMLSLEQTGSPWDANSLEATEHALKREVATNELAAEVRRLARAMRRDNFSTAGPHVSEEQLIDTIVELVAFMPVYRADYISLSRVTARVIADMAHRFPSHRDALDIVAAALLADGEAKTRFAQVCGAVMAKGVEDTTFYQASRLVALQEVGGAPGRFGVSAAEFHLLQHERAILWPSSMTTLSTHDTKRGEDVRARIIEISEVPSEFTEFVRRVTAITPPPDGATGHFLLQNLIGIWPSVGSPSASVLARFQAYAKKAIREAGVHTTWTEPNEQFESSIEHWVAALFNGPATNLIAEFVATIAHAGITLTLGRKLLQLIAPGVPDIYQGNEFFTDYLVDPDNRAFVDYTSRSQALALLQEVAFPAEALAQAPIAPDNAETDYPQVFSNPDLAKLAITKQSLAVRQQHPECFVGGSYQAVFAVGPAESHVVGIARGSSIRDIRVVALAMRRPITLARRGGWDDTSVTLPEGQWEDQLTGRRYAGVVAASEIFATLPTALLVAV
ncbi:malto-oligosyltrehalose synthase [Corynebacterium epidermidicanis]|uniref:Malto-oligosyltrehalose synthase n=1 Tax=Corynebacterium epidermidicanis TaxID=1050174 RepID=A0A0G3GX85_9CORY|nr:malto-oligosyltrehalose synthase [Corynebacterium epidermidicanis]AKK03487.1 malto-oligosyltrehalose synthase [Corynebacterium epidermidicanis]